MSSMEELSISTSKASFVGEIVVSQTAEQHEQAEAVVTSASAIPPQRPRDQWLAASDALKGIQDADNGAEETDEWSVER